jgi:REP element-mobilizing transposase RayT
MPQSFACLHYHLIFSTKDRASMIVYSIRQRLYDYVGGITKNDQGRLLAAGGTGDHMHLLVSLRPQPAIANVLRDIKANSSRWVHETFPNMGAFGWQDGYGAFTVSYSQLEQVRRYIQEQEEHHHKMTFQEEFIQFLERHGVEYSPEHIWR